MAEVQTTMELPFPPQFLYQIWSDVESYPQWMDHLASVKRTGPKTSRWIMQRRTGDILAWDTELTVTRPGEKIAWSSVEGDLHTYGSVTFNAIPGGTRLTWRRFHGVDMEQDPEVLTGRFADPKAKLEHDMANFRLYLGTLTRGSPIVPTSTLTQEIPAAPVEDVPVAATAPPQRDRRKVVARAPPNPTSAGTNLPA